MKMNRALAPLAFALVASSLAACGAPPTGSDGEEPAVDSRTVTVERRKDDAKPVVEFDLHINPKFANCLAAHPGDPNNAPWVHAKVARGQSSRGEQNDLLVLTGGNIKPGLQFDVFTVERSQLNAQAAVDPAFHGFGLAWYQSDLQANGNGQVGVAVRTILLDQIFGFDPDVKLDPTGTFHLGFWFNNPEDAVACGFDPAKFTPFNGDHHAGPLAMISVPPTDGSLGPLCTQVDWSTSPPHCKP